MFNGQNEKLNAFGVDVNLAHNKAMQKAVDEVERSFPNGMSDSLVARDMLNRVYQQKLQELLAP